MSYLKFTQRTECEIVQNILNSVRRLDICKNLEIEFAKRARLEQRHRMKGENQKYRDKGGGERCI